MKIGKLTDYLRDYGLQGTAAAAADRLLHRPVKEVPYETWLDRSRPSSRDYARMSREELYYRPLIGVKAYMEGQDRTAFLQSLSLQVYRNFRALKDCPDAGYILLAGPGCTLTPDMMWQCAKLLSDSMSETAGILPDIDLVYFDSDVIGEDGHKTDPAFRPEYDPDLLESVNYMGSTVLVRASLAREAGLPPNREKASLHAFLKRVCARIQVRPGRERRGRIRHIPMILYHETGEADAFGRKVLPEDSPAGPFSASSVSIPAGPGLRETPAVSVLIPNKDHAEDLRQCIASLQDINTFRDIEILVLENNSREKETFDYYAQAQAEDSRIRVLTWEGAFNYSAINNFGAANAKGDCLLLLNNDTVILEPGSVGYLLEQAMREDVGAAGALLMYPDHTIQHAGIILGHGGIAAHAFQGEASARDLGTYPELVFSHRHNVSAVTGACLMIRRSVFLKAGGFDEQLAVTFNDVDLCLRLRREGLRILMCPDAKLIHDESLSRGSEDTEEKVARFHREISIFVSRWAQELEEGDPFYSPCLTLTGRSWTCRDERREARKPYLKYLHMDA